ncbi:pentatricopeptide repeat-containing protein At3g16610-like [Nymphaea colorata]|nr:pentatricopeptide repeat-containing protein At3g16610-like [Nymphaea colorata]XP_031475023.1 pentatricopeptide repeat-containing protein At3g16610-like [Nymphaea colorata]XP_049931792.1 pentatricopeptide repeat-containing protein At3g16610-like [Nymphaea colorata]XP_049931793.1 pentatricopeptide repeat-containing protein At3g16610-like [Nymphaea colorata]XP_049931794.1 pentatricopeptide repeat-containing protein At3g16610-like [Nymphaea colorata]
MMVPKSVLVEGIGNCTSDRLVRLLHFSISPAHHRMSKPTNSNFMKDLCGDRELKKAVEKLQSTHQVEMDTYTKLLEACIRLKSLSDGRKIHDHIVKFSQFKNAFFVLEKLTCMYVACGEIEMGQKVFDQIPRANVFLWNLMIRGYAWSGPFDQALVLYRRMIYNGVSPNKFTFPFVLKACSGLSALEDGRKIHDDAVRAGLESDVFVATALIDMYSKCGCLDSAYQVFEKMSQRDVVAWNSMAAGCALHGLYDDVVCLVLEMQQAGLKPNSSTLVSVLPVFGEASALRQGKSIHSYCVRRCFHLADVLVNTALLHMYAKCECLNYSWRLFATMAAKNEVAWSAMVASCIRCGHMKEALELFDQMVMEGNKPTTVTITSALRACAGLTNVGRGQQVHGYSVKVGFESDITTANSVLSMYSKCAVIDDAIKFFHIMPNKDSVSFSAIISGCVQNGNANEALHIFSNMQLEVVEPDIATMVGVLPACAQLSAIKHGQCNHGYIVTRGFSWDISINNALIDMYSKCGNVEFAREVFNRMSDKDIVSWNSMISGYGIHGRGEEALALFNDMLLMNLDPDEVTFICLLSTCSHCGLINEGKQLFELMQQRFGITPRMEHYICVVDLLGRGGLLGEAYNFIKSMPFRPDVRVWGALLGACRIHKNVEIGEEVSKIIHQLGPEGTGNFVLISNIYSAARRWKDAASIRIMQKDMGFRKSPGCSWIEIGNTIHAFVGGDQSHPQSAHIYELLEELLGKIKKLGYQPDTSFVLQDVEEEEKEHILRHHSEKLALAFGILNFDPGKTICITKNLRVCGDCHSAIKFFSKITERTIIVRDAIRFHHFKDGMCSCGDFW